MPSPSKRIGYRAGSKTRQKRECQRSQFGDLLSQGDAEGIERRFERAGIDLGPSAIVALSTMCRFDTPQRTKRPIA
jgi:hypothetical protein